MNWYTAPNAPNAKCCDPSFPKPTDLNTSVSC